MKPTRSVRDRRGAASSIAMLLLFSSAAVAQRTGALLNRPHADEGFLANARRAKGDTVFAALVFDPLLATLARASAWSATVDPKTKVASVQLNLCDMAGALCDSLSASSLTLAGPLDAGAEFTRLADLDGLVGSAKVQVSYTTNNMHPGKFYSVSGSFGQPSFAYRDSATLRKRSVDRAEYSVEAGSGYRWNSAELHGALRVGQAYNARQAQNVCSPAAFGPSGTETCANVTLAPPASAPSTVAVLSGAWSVKGNGAARLTISYDMRNSVTGIDLPVWVLQDPRGGLGGGVRFGYRTDDKQVTVSVFVTTFKL